MKARSIATLIFAQCLAAGLAQAECTRESPPEMPDGRTASMEEMAAAQGAVKSFVASVAEYHDCMDKDIKIAEEEEDADKHEDLVKQFNAADDMKVQTASDFNKEVKAYKKAQK